MLNERSKSKLVGVNPKLVSVVEKAAEISEVDFIVTEGVRTLERQKQLFEKKLSKTLKSKHLVGRAVDVAAVVDGKVSWDWAPYTKIAKAMKEAAKLLGVVIVWGGDWKTIKDGPHFELGEQE